MKKISWKNILISLAIGFIVLMLGFLFWIKKITVPQIIDAITHKEITITFKEGTSDEDIEQVIRDIGGESSGCFNFICGVKVSRIKPFVYFREKLIKYPYIKHFYPGQPGWSIPLEIE